jgi:hypothetical protein
MLATSTTNRVGVSAGAVSAGASVVEVVVGSAPTVVVVSASVAVLQAARVNAPATKNTAPLLVILMISPVLVTRAGVVVRRTMRSTVHDPELAGVQILFPAVNEP